MQHSHNVDIVKAVLGSQEMVVYGEDLLRHSVADGEAMHVTVAAIPIGRPESAAVLKVYFAQCGNVTWGKVLDAAHGLVDCLTSEFIATFKMLVRWHFSCKNRILTSRKIQPRTRPTKPTESDRCLGRTGRWKKADSSAWTLYLRGAGEGCGERPDSESYIRLLQSLRMFLKVLDNYARPLIYGALWW
jgi:hypothetical protein